MTLLEITYMASLRSEETIFCVNKKKYSYFFFLTGNEIEFRHKDPLVSEEELDFNESADAAVELNCDVARRLGFRVLEKAVFERPVRKILASNAHPHVNFRKNLPC